MAISYETMIVAPKSQEASFYKINQDNKVNSEQPMLQQSVEQQKLRDSQRTNRTEDKNSQMGHHDAKEKGSNEYEHFDAEKKKKEEEQKMNEAHRILMGSTFDITI